MKARRWWTWPVAAILIAVVLFALDRLFPPPLPDHAAAGQTLAAPATAARSGSGYVLQSATFVDPGRAEEWQAMLAQEGIPSTIEARLQIGPFSSRTEAEAARRKMNKLGLDTVGGLRKTRKP